MTQQNHSPDRVAMTTGRCGGLDAAAVTRPSADGLRAVADERVVRALANEVGVVEALADSASSPRTA